MFGRAVRDSGAAKRLGEIVGVFRAPASVESDQSSHRVTIILILSFMAVVCAVMSFINYRADSMGMLIATTVLALVFLAATVLFVKTNNERVVSVLIISILALIFTYFFIIGGNDGFAALWILIIPSVTVSLYGLQLGTDVSLYFAIVVVALCWTPASALLQYEYNESFMTRFPVAYMTVALPAIFLGYRIKKAQIKELSYQSELEAAVREEREKVSQLSIAAILSMKNAIEAKNPYTQKHSERVERYAVMIAGELGWTPEQLQSLENKTLLHDIGKIGMPDCILNKAGKLTKQEFDMIQRHTTIGSDVLKNFTVIDALGEVALDHHERYDGRGYPAGLHGTDIPIEARIVGVADTIDAMNSDRVYRAGMTTETIIAELRAGRGTQFDPEVADVAIGLLEKRIIDCDRQIAADTDAFLYNAPFCTMVGEERRER